MLGKTKAFSGFSVDDIEKARQFYADTLGIDTSEQYGLLTLHLAGGRDTLVYPKPGHVPATYTILNFRVEDIDATLSHPSLSASPVSVRRTRSAQRTAQAAPAETRVANSGISSTIPSMLLVMVKA
jgi:catechol 2,3-dioxygenase-like lactoylglutathione lyase family enzyme